MVDNRHALWAPDIIRESNGIACGDMLSINAYRENGNLFFSYSGNACSVARKVSSYLEETFSGKNESIINESLARLRREQFNEAEKWIAECIKFRRNCVDSPISLLSGIIGVEVSCDINNRENNVLACDACVSTKPINWKPEKKEKRVTTLKSILTEVNNIDNPKEIEFQELGLCVLTKEQQENFNKKLENISEADFKLIKKLRLASLLFNNAQKYNLKMDARIEELAVKQVVSLAVANEEIRIIDNYINNKKLKIDAVKGGRTNQYYPKGFVRTHMDFDYLAAEFEDAFKLISYLINDRNFKLVIGGSVPFSLKSVLNLEQEEVLTGHIHLEKILQNKYQVVVDINMGGFPLGRTGIIQCNNMGKLELEDLVCITVAHLFKHEHAFIKDINDLYWLLESEEIDTYKLLSKIKKYGLSNLFAVAYEFLRTNMHLSKELPVEQEQVISEKRKEGWPFSRKAHFYIKAIDMMLLNKTQYGIKQGVKETINQICGVNGEIDSNKYGNLFNKMNERTYLYPIVFFKSYQGELKSDILSEIDFKIMLYNRMLILPIGIFLIQNSINNELNRDSLTQDIEFLLQQFGLDERDCNMSYVMEARKDTWLY